MLSFVPIEPVDSPPVTTHQQHHTPEGTARRATKKAKVAPIDGWTAVSEVVAVGVHGSTREDLRSGA